jgi:tRNA-modifying protein YgfZ
LNHVVNNEINQKPVTVIAQEINFEVGYRIVAQKESCATILENLDTSGMVAVTSDIFEILRVEAGKPGAVNELTDAYTPLEVQLQDMISDSKGCYTGQEIIARQITYDKVTKNLVGIKLSGFVDAGANLEVGNKSAGVLTSVVHSPRFGPIGLGIVRRPYRKIGTHLSAQNEAVSDVEGIVAELPFR